MANCVRIPNLGEKHITGYTDNEGLQRSFTAQICDVNKPLLSVRRVTQAGNRVVFEEHGGYIEDMKTGEKMWIKEKDGMYLLKLWVRKGGQAPEQGFIWQGQ